MRGCSLILHLLCKDGKNFGGFKQCLKSHKKSREKIPKNFDPQIKHPPPIKYAPVLNLVMSLIKRMKLVKNSSGNKIGQSGHKPIFQTKFNIKTSFIEVAIHLQFFVAFLQGYVWRSLK